MAIVAIHQQSQCRNTVGGAFSGLPQLTYQSRDWAFWERGGGLKETGAETEHSYRG